MKVTVREGDSANSSGITELRYNLRSTTTGDWALTGWTSASRYFPDLPIDVGLGLFDQRRDDSLQLPHSEVSLSLLDANTGQQLREAQVLANFRRVGASHEWRANVQMPVAADEVRGISAVGPGSYRLDVAVVIKDTAELKLQDMQFEVKPFREPFRW
jgi:hypothetical protein